MNLAIANPTLEIPPRLGMPTSWSTGLLGLVLGLLLAAAAPPLWDAARDGVRSWTGMDRIARVASGAPTREWPDRPIPPEWRWTAPTVDVAGMFPRRR